MPRQAAYARQYPGKYSPGEAIHIYLLLRNERVETAVLFNGYYTGHFRYSGIA